MVFRIPYKYKVMPLILERLFVRQKNYVSHRTKSYHSRHDNLSFLNRDLGDFSLVVHVDYH
jgi:hypothetical protein